MNEQSKTNESPIPAKDEHCCTRGCGEGGHCRRGRCFGKLLAVMVVFGLGFLSGKAYSCEPGLGPGGPAAFMAGKPMDAERMGEFAEKRVKHMLDEVKASDEQKAKAVGIVKASLSKGAPLAEKMRDNHTQLHKLMSAATLDKAAIEALRVEQIKLADEASKLATQTMQDVAEVLTPEQRAKLAATMEKRHAGPHHG